MQRQYDSSTSVIERPEFPDHNQYDSALQPYRPEIPIVYQCGEVTRAKVLYPVQPPPPPPVTSPYARQPLYYDAGTDTRNDQPYDAILDNSSFYINESAYSQRYGAGPFKYNQDSLDPYSSYTPLRTYHLSQSDCVQIDRFANHDSEQNDSGIEYCPYCGAVGNRHGRTVHDPKCERPRCDCHARGRGFTCESCSKSNAETGMARGFEMGMRRNVDTVREERSASMRRRK